MLKSEEKHNGGLCSLDTPVRTCVCVCVCMDSFVLEFQVLNIQPELFVASGVGEPDPHFALKKKRGCVFPESVRYHITKRPDSSCVSVRAKVCPECFRP